MSQNRNTPPRTRPDLGRPTGHHRPRRDGRARTIEGDQDTFVEGVTGLRPDLPPTEDPYPSVTGTGWLGVVTAGVISAVAGWVLVAALASLAWLTAPLGSYGDVLAVATQVWLSGHGGGMFAGGTSWTLVPYGLTVLLGWLLAQVSMAVLRRAGEPEVAPALVRLVRGGLLALTYAVVVGLVGLFTGNAGQPVKAGVGAFVMAVLAGWWARSKVGGWRLGTWWPGWSRHLPRALVAGSLALVAVGSVALVTGLVVHRGQLVVLTAGFGGGVLGGLGVIVAQLAFLPTVIVWATSYALGAGFGLGDGSLVSPSDTHVGMLPGWPLTAALPPQGPGSPLGLAWLAGGVLAGALAAWVYLRGSRWSRPDTAMAFGGLVGLLLGLLTTLAGLLARGDLGSARLTGLGPRLLELLVLATTLTTAGGLVSGLVFGIVRWVGRRRTAASTAPLEVSGTLLSSAPLLDGTPPGPAQIAGMPAEPFASPPADGPTAPRPVPPDDAAADEPVDAE